MCRQPPPRARRIFGQKIRASMCQSERNTGLRGVSPCQSSGVEIRAEPGWRSEEFSERSEGHGWPKRASARRHGLTPSPREGNSPNGPPSGRLRYRCLVGGDRGLGGLVMRGLAGFRGPGWPNDPPSGRLRYRCLVGGDRGLGGLVMRGLAGFRGPGWPNDPPSRPARAGGLLCVNLQGIRVREG